MPPVFCIQMDDAFFNSRVKSLRVDGVRALLVNPGAEGGFAGIPAGERGFFWGFSGDVAALNPRLMALIPPGSCCPVLLVVLAGG